MTRSSGSEARQFLLVEDNPGDADYVQDLLTRASERGDQVVLVPTLAEAVTALQEVPIDAVLLDLRLPDSSGLESVHAVLSRYPDAAIIVLTGLDDEDVALACLRAGAQDYIRKDEVQEERLRQAIGYAIARTGEKMALRREAALLEELAEAERQRTESLAAREAQMRALNARLNAVREEERTRISRTVHDELGPSLTALKLDLQWMRRTLQREEAVPVDSLVDRLDSATALVDQTVGTVQRVAVELRPSVLDSLGLASAVRDELHRFTRGTTLQPSMSVDLEERCPPEVETALFRILQELLSNVVRHADATRLQLALRRDCDDVLLQVRDDGVGIPEVGAERRGALGLLGARERAAALGGTVAVGRRPEGGTQVEIRIPVASSGSAS